MTFFYDPQYFGESVKARRLKIKMSQETLAELADVHRTYIYKIETGKVVVSLAVAVRIAEALKISLCKLLN